MPERIQRKAIYPIHSLATLLGVSEQALTTAFQSGALPGRQIGRVWYCTGQSLLKYFQGADPLLLEPESSPAEAAQVVPQHPDPSPPESPTTRAVPRRPKRSPASRAKKSTSRVEAVQLPNDTQAKKRYLADQVKQAREQTDTYKEAAELLNQKKIPSLSGSPWTHRSVDNLLRWGRLNPPI